MLSLLKIIGTLSASAIGLGCAGITAAAIHKSTDPQVIRMGMSGDFTTLAIITGVLAFVFLGVAGWLVVTMLPRKGKRPEDTAAHF